MGGKVGKKVEGNQEMDELGDEGCVSSWFEAI